MLVFLSDWSLGRLYSCHNIGNGIAAGDTCSGGATAGIAAYGQLVEGVGLHPVPSFLSIT